MPEFNRQSPFCAQSSGAFERIARRQRLCERLLSTGVEATNDLELLELVLSRGRGRKDVGALASRLLAEFGNFNGVISAPAKRLSRVVGVNHTIIADLKIIEAAAQTMARTKVLHRDVLSSWDALLGYCKTKMANLEREQLRVLFLDRQNVLIADEALATGTVDHVPVYPREIFRRGLELSASALILVHNHPSGEAKPSPDDIAMTNLVKRGAETLGFVLHDHLIIGKSEPFSFKACGLL